MEDDNMNSQVSNLLLHVNAPISNAQLQLLQHAVGGVAGVRRVAPSVRLERLLMVDYDPLAVSARSILARVQIQGHAAQLVGL